jgi:hypothetical protein
MFIALEYLSPFYSLTLFIQHPQYYDTFCMTKNFTSKLHPLYNYDTR